MKLYQKLASLVSARENCLLTNNNEWAEKHEENIINLVKNYMPCGSGFNEGTTIDLEKSTNEKLIFNSAFHFSDDKGLYADWVEFIAVVTPSLQFGLNVCFCGKGKAKKMFYQNIDYFTDVFSDCLDKEV